MLVYKSHFTGNQHHSVLVDSVLSNACRCETSVSSRLQREVNKEMIKNTVKNASSLSSSKNTDLTQCIFFFHESALFRQTCKLQLFVSVRKIREQVKHNILYINICCNMYLCLALLQNCKAVIGREKFRVQK